MNKIILITFLFISMSSCKGQKKIEMIEDTGLLTENQSFSKMYFKTKNEGYLFGKYQKWQEMTDEDLNNPEFNPKELDFAIICKTEDGGKTWQLIDSIAHREFMDYYTIMGDDIFIGQSDFYGDQYYISKFNLLNDSLTVKQNDGHLGGITFCNQDIIYRSNYEYLYFLDDNLNTIKKENVGEIGNEILCVKNRIFSKGRNMKGKSEILNISSPNLKINLSFSPEQMLKYNDENLLLVGNNENDVVIAKYNIETQKEEILKKFKGYRIVKEVQYNGKIITGLMGNISGMFVDYVLFYSTDSGETWQISNLKERSYVHPTYLIDNILYIYSGAGRIQKIEF